MHYFLNYRYTCICIQCMYVQFINICKTQIDVQALIDIQSSNPCLISTSQATVPQIYALSSNSQIGVQFSNLCPFSNSKIGIQFSNLWPFLTFSN